MGEAPVVGSEELASGRLNRHRLRVAYRPVFPNVYLPAQVEPTLPLRIRAAWLWSGRTAVIAGAGAAAVHGAAWIPDAVPIELIHHNTRAPDGVLIRRDGLCPGETQICDGLAVTTPERTAFDIGRRGAVRSAVVRLDSLARATGFKVDDVLRVAGAHPRSPGLRRLEAALGLSTPVRSHRGRATCGCCSSTRVCPGRRPRSRCRAPTACPSRTWTWAGPSGW